MEKKFRSGFSLKINWTLGKMSENSLSIQEEEILMEEIMSQLLTNLFSVTDLT